MGTQVSIFSRESFTWTVQVLERHKIRLPEQIYVRIPVLSTSSATVMGVGIPGEFGGLQVIFGDDVPPVKLRRRLDKIAELGKAQPERAGESWTLLARYLSNAWDMTFSFRDNRYTAVLPNVARDLGLVPKEQGQDVLIFLYGQILEIWRPDAWNAINNNTRSRVDLLEENLPENEREDS